MYNKMESNRQLEESVFKLTKVTLFSNSRNKGRLEKEIRKKSKLESTHRVNSNFCSDDKLHLDMDSLFEEGPLVTTDLQVNITYTINCL
jgi:hypothetical protein